MPSLIEHSSASSIGPPMMMNMSFTPCAFRHRARISLPVSSAILRSSLPCSAGCTRPTDGVGRTQSAIGTSDHPFVAQGLDLARTHAEPFPEDMRRVLSEQWGGLELRRLPVEAHRPGRHLERA